MPAQRRYNEYRGAKRQVTAEQPGRAAPAWKVNQQARKTAVTQNAEESKILLSNLPADVGREEVVALFTKTVGKVSECFIVFNSQGNSKGMAVVTFARAQDASLARAKYNGKIIDGRRPIKIEIVKDADDVPRPAQQAASIPSLLQRLGGAPLKNGAPAAQLIQPKKQAQPPTQGQIRTQTRAVPAPSIPANARATRRPLRQKKGPRRIKKVPLTAAQLDAEMDSYRAKAEDDAES